MAIGLDPKKTKEKEAKSGYGIVSFEKRKFPRFKVDLPIEYHRINSLINQTARSLNVSAGGLQISVPEQMEIGQRLRLKLFFPSASALNTAEVLAEVVWTDVRPNERWWYYRYGARFIDIAIEDMTKLKKFLVSFSQ